MGEFLISNISHVVNGADINRSYLEANKSNYSMSDLSCWFSQFPQNSERIKDDDSKSIVRISNTTTIDPNFNHRETDMSNFKLLLSKVKEIVDDSYSDNTELSAATQNLENVLDSIIHCEEKIRQRRTQESPK